MTFVGAYDAHTLLVEDERVDLSKSVPLSTARQTHRLNAGAAATSPPIFWT